MVLEASFQFIFGLFQTNNTIDLFQQINVKNLPYLVFQLAISWSWVSFINH